MRKRLLDSQTVSAALGGLSGSYRRRVLWLLAAATVVQLRVFLTFEGEMRRTGDPGIIPFELVGGTARAAEILDIWGEEGRSAARKSLFLDYLFPPTYGALQAFACDSSAAEGFARRNRRFLAAAGLPIGWRQLTAAAFDYVENTALLLVLAGRHQRAPRAAQRAAQVKFTLTSLGQAYILTAGIDAGMGCRNGRAGSRTR